MRLYRTAAAAAGLSLGDYIALHLARAHALTEPGYITKPDSKQLELPASA